MQNCEISSILSLYSVALVPQKVQFLGSAGGFSGALFWRIETGKGPFCLRRWPTAHPSAGQLNFIHQVLRHVVRSGVEVVSQPLLSDRGETFVEQQGHFWELADWMPGEPETRRQMPPVRLRNTMTLLARFHQAAEQFLPTQIRRSCPAVGERLRRITGLQKGGLQQLHAAIDESIWPGGFAVSQRLVELAGTRLSPVAEELRSVKDLEVPILPCIRDIWRDHVLFQADEVTGLIDFGAMQQESVACDLSRLLGSIVGDDQPTWNNALGDYAACRKLTSEERRLTAVLDRSSVLLSGLNWVDWIYCQGRTFEGRERIAGRLERLAERLALLDSGQFP